MAIAHSNLYNLLCLLTALPTLTFLTVSADCYLVSTPVPSVGPPRPSCQNPTLLCLLSAVQPIFLTSQQQTLTGLNYCACCLPFIPQSSHSPSTFYCSTFLCMLTTLLPSSHPPRSFLVKPFLTYFVLLQVRTSRFSPAR